MRHAWLAILDQDASGYGHYVNSLCITICHKWKGVSQFGQANVTIQVISAVILIGMIILWSLGITRWIFVLLVGIPCLFAIFILGHGLFYLAPAFEWVLNNRRGK
jgi:hypothetical protein